ncbi:MAG TPA: ABC transporter permease subunit, partial [Syntrophobacteria bacterium]|nr:ABC transporter permease subunit [Syntrophobacteria bacterium]
MWEYYLKELAHSLPFFLQGLWITFAVSGLSLVAGTVIGFALGIIRVSRLRFLPAIIGGWVDVIRGTPFLVQVFVV